jgi:hypothetical protein
MSFNYSPKIVTDGLVLYLDAANTKSYVSGNTTWNDISRSGYNGTLTNGPTFSISNGGGISFDGVDDYVIMGSINDIQGNKPFSVSGWVKRSGDWSGGATWGIGGGNTGTGINTYNGGNTNEITIDLWGVSTYTTNQTYSTTNWKYVVWTYNGSEFTTSNITIYINSIPYTGVDLSVLRGGAGTPNIVGGVVLGRADVVSNAYYGKPIISNFKIHNRVLSSSEVLQNYNTTKSRFGL